MISRQLATAKGNQISNLNQQQFEITPLSCQPKGEEKKPISTQGRFLSSYSPLHPWTASL